MRYSDRGGLSAGARAGRQALRLDAAGMLEAGMDVGEIAQSRALTRKSVNAWKRSWRAGGIDAWASKGPGGATCRLHEIQLKVLQQALDRGPAAHGWSEDRRWTLARATRLIFELFRVRHTPRGASYLPRRIGHSPQLPQHVAAERDEQQAATWIKQDRPRIKALPSG